MQPVFFASYYRITQRHFTALPTLPKTLSTLLTARKLIKNSCFIRPIELYHMPILCISLWVLVIRGEKIKNRQLFSVDRAKSKIYWCVAPILMRKKHKKESVRVVYRVNCTWSEMGQNIRYWEQADFRCHVTYWIRKTKKTNTKQIYFGPSKIQKCQSMQISGTHLYSGRRAHPPPPSTAAHKDLCVFHIDNALTMNFHQILSSHSPSPLCANCCIINM